MKCKILMFAASPADQHQLALAREAREIRLRLRQTPYRDQFSLETRWAVRARDIVDEINFEDPDVVHISGHGTKASEWVFENDAGTSAPMSKKKMRELFDSVKSKIKVVLLNGCYSDEIAEAVTSSVDCAIGMKDPVSDATATEFSTMFYSALGAGKSVNQAFKQATAVAESADCQPKIRFGSEVDRASLHLLPSLTLTVRKLVSAARRKPDSQYVRGGTAPTSARPGDSPGERRESTRDFALRPNSTATLFVPTRDHSITYYRANPQQLAVRRGKKDDVTIVSHPQPMTLSGSPFDTEFMLRRGESTEFVINFFLDNRPEQHHFIMSRVTANRFTLFQEILS